MYSALLKLILLIVVVATTTRAATVQTVNGPVTIEDYTLDHLSIQDFNTTTATLAVYNPGAASCPACIDGCTSYDLPGDIPVAWRNAVGGNLAIVLSSENCAITKAVRHVVSLQKQLEELQTTVPVANRTRIVAVLQLFNPRGLSSTPDDEAVRFTENPYTIRRAGNLIVQRAKDRDGGVVFRDAMGCNFAKDDFEGNCVLPGDSNTARQVDFEFSFTVSPWKTQFTGTGWSIYIATGFLLFGYCAVFSGRSLWYIHQKNKDRVNIYGSAISLQQFALRVVFAVSAIRIIDYTITFFRDTLQIWIPEVLGSLIWIWGYLGSVTLLLILWLYWGELLRTTSRKLTSLSQPSKVALYSFLATFISLTSIFTLLFALRVTTKYWVFIFLSSGMLATVGMSASFGMIYFGRKILYRLGTQNAENNMPSDKFGTSSRKHVVAKLKTMRPLSRLMMGTASLVSVIFILTALSFLTPILRSPGALYVTLFYMLQVVEAASLYLAAYTVSPLSKRKQRNNTRGTGLTAAVTVPTMRATMTATGGSSLMNFGANTYSYNSHSVINNTSEFYLDSDDEDGMPPI